MKLCEIICPIDVQLYGRKKWQTLYTTDKRLACYNGDAQAAGCSAEEEIELYNCDTSEIYEYIDEDDELVSRYDL